jgi:hypothetical protein
MLNRPTDLFIPGEITRITEGRVAPDDRPRFDEKLSRLHDWFLDGSRREARAGARLIAWPEQSLLVFSEGEARFIERAQRLAAEEHVYLAMGLGTSATAACRLWQLMSAASPRQSASTPTFQNSYDKQPAARLTF